MTVEAALCKLAFLLAQDISRDEVQASKTLFVALTAPPRAQVRRLMGVDMRGELTRTDSDEMKFSVTQSSFIRSVAEVMKISVGKSASLIASALGPVSDAGSRPRCWRPSTARFAHSHAGVTSVHRLSSTRPLRAGRWTSCRAWCSVAFPLTQRTPWAPPRCTRPPPPGRCVALSLASGPRGSCHRSHLRSQAQVVKYLLDMGAAVNKLDSRGALITCLPVRLRLAAYQQRTAVLRPQA
jgi:hypothetical protein